MKSSKLSSEELRLKAPKTTKETTSQKKCSYHKEEKKKLKRLYKEY